MTKLVQPIDTIVVIHRIKAKKGLGINYVLFLDIGPEDSKMELFENDKLHRNWKNIEDMYEDIADLIQLKNVPMIMYESKYDKKKRIMPEEAEKYWNQELRHICSFDDLPFQSKKYKKYKMRHPLDERFVRVVA
jgi:hypothetical protein